MLGCGEHALKADDDEVVEEVAVDMFGSAAHVFLLET